MNTTESPNLLKRLEEQRDADTGCTRKPPHTGITTLAFGQTHHGVKFVERFQDLADRSSPRTRRGTATRAS